MSKDSLIAKIQGLGIVLDEERLLSRKRNVKYTNLDLVNILADYYLAKRETKSFGLRARLQFETVSLAERFSALKDFEQKELFESDSWIAEPKLNGARMLICYHPDEGFSFVSRGRSDVDFLPLEYTSKILLIKDGLVKSPEDFKNKFTFSFILDCEILLSGNINMAQYYKHGGSITNSEQNATAAVLQMLPELSKKVQVDQNQFIFHVFDCLYFRDSFIIDKPLNERKAIQEGIVNALIAYLPFENVPRYLTKEEKEAQWDYQLKNKGEGLVFKNLHKPYSTSHSRDKTVQVKLKRSMTAINKIENAFEDIDAFISGYSLSNQDKKFKDFVGSIHFSVMLIKDDGSQVEHHIATISGMDLDLRKAMTVTGDDGLPALNPEYLGKVCSINGMSVSSKQLRLNHPVSNFVFRDDKTYEQCVMSEKFLKNNII